MFSTAVLIIAAAAVLLLVLLAGGVAWYYTQEPEYAYDLSKYAGVYYYPESEGLDYFVFGADSTYSHYFIKGSDTVAIDGRWTTGRKKTYSFSIPEVDFFYVHFFRWADGELPPVLESEASDCAGNLQAGQEPFMMKACYWDASMISFPVWNGCRQIDFLRVRNMKMADSLGIKIKEGDFVPLPQNIDPADCQRVWVDCD